MDAIGTSTCMGKVLKLNIYNLIFIHIVILYARARPYICLNDTDRNYNAYIVQSMIYELILKSIFI